MNPFDRAKTISKTEGGKTLVIIDMQTGFIDGCDATGAENVICKMVEHARQQKWGILVVEFDGYGDTIDSIAQAVGGYEMAHDVVKDHMGGGEEVMECLNRHPELPRDLVVCGIFGEQCVSRTIYELCLMQEIPVIDVLEDGIAPEYATWDANNSSTEEENTRLVSSSDFGVEVPAVEYGQPSLA